MTEMLVDDGSKIGKLNFMLREKGWKLECSADH